MRALHSVRVICLKHPAHFAVCGIQPLDRIPQLVRADPGRPKFN